MSKGQHEEEQLQTEGEQQQEQQAALQSLPCRPVLGNVQEAGADGVLPYCDNVSPAFMNAGWCCRSNLLDKLVTMERTAEMPWGCKYSCHSVLPVCVDNPSMPKANISQVTVFLEGKYAECAGLQADLAPSEAPGPSRDSRSAATHRAASDRRRPTAPIGRKVGLITGTVIRRHQALRLDTSASLLST